MNTAIVETIAESSKTFESWKRSVSKPMRIAPIAEAQLSKDIESVPARLDRPIELANTVFERQYKSAIESLDSTVVIATLTWEIN